MRSQQMLQLLQSSGHLAATIGPRAGTASCVSGLLRGFLANEQSASVSGGQNRGLSAEAVPVVNDQVGLETLCTSMQFVGHSWVSCWLLVIEGLQAVKAEMVTWAVHCVLMKPPMSTLLL